MQKQDKEKVRAEWIQTVYKRYELKYLLTTEQKETILAVLQQYMTLDKYGRATIRNVYYDTDTYLLVRRSIEKPVYKEKLRIRSYRQATEESLVYVELKKKHMGVVYKRRVSLENDKAMGWLSGETKPEKDSQIAREIDYFIGHYGTLHPVVFLSYEREAYYANDGSDFRVTFDDTILCRQEDLSLTSPIYGTPILPEGKVLMEIKCSRGIPLWMTDVLSKEKIYKSAFSKYGTAYQTLIFPEIHSINAHNMLEVTAND